MCDEVGVTHGCSVGAAKEGDEVQQVCDGAVGNERWRRKKEEEKRKCVHRSCEDEV